MNQLYTNYLHIIKSICRNSEKTHIFSGKDLENLYQLAAAHFTVPFLLPYADPSSTLFGQIKQQTKLMMLHYYQIEQFTIKLADLLEKEKISYILLKGISLAAYYPVPDQRKLGDVDLYLPDPKDLKTAKQLLESNGFRPTEDSELSDHHLTYLYTFPQTGRTYTLELHFRIIGLYQYVPANKIVDSVFACGSFQPVLQNINGRNYPVLPPTEYVFYMLHHMLKHYLYSGFGIRLLCDFTLYLTRYADEIDFSRIHLWCQDSKILHLYEIILESCRLYLGLSEQIDPDIHYAHSDCETFIEQVLSDGDVGKGKGNELVRSGSYEKVNWITYFKEGHIQMKVRFPKLHKCILFWPVLWCITLIAFLHNTYHLRNTTFRQTLKDFKKSNQDAKLIRIFDNSDDTVHQ